MSDVGERLTELRAAGMYRRLRLVESPQGPRVTLDGTEVLLLCSNNYLGLADHPRIRQAASDAAERFGAGAGASRLISGNMSLHERLERRLADFTGYEAALLFGSGYLANVGTVSALVGRGQVVFSDELNHASLIDGCRISRAERFVYRHRDLEHLAWGLRKANGRAALIVTDSLFSMDGDVAPVAGLVELARRHSCRLLVDEAHAIGSLGPDGCGAVSEAGLSGEVDVVVGTLGKTLGSYGAYVCASAEVVELLVNVARPFIFSTGLPPPAVGAAIAALAMLDAQPGMVEHLRRNSATLREALIQQGLDPGRSRTQIIPVVVGDAQSTMELCERTLEGRVFAQAIRPPTVPPGTSRLRLSVMANHRPSDLCAAARVIARAMDELGIVPMSRATSTSAAAHLREAA
jgi:glycine C-acetyltransferase/8-amino-7-oxononanoate synthase